MNEHVAREVVLVRAIESADSGRAIFTDEDRLHASRAAAELARWRAAEQRRASSAELFIGERAELLAKTLQRRSPALARAAHLFEWREWIGFVLPAVAFATGVLVEHIADRQHVNLLAFPLLAIILWNMAVYVVLVMRATLRAAGSKIDARGPRRWLASIAQRSARLPGGPAADSSREFATQWGALVAPLMAARAARVLHLSAALLALGAIVGLYVRGLIFEYRAGWESTFLDAAAVHSILSFVLGPAAQWIGTPFPSVEQVAAMRFAGGAPAATTGATNAALWIHLYAVTVGAIVIAPRVVLALFAVWQERRRSHFTFDLTEPYFRRLAGSFAGGAAALLRVVPYSYTPDETALQGLRSVASTLLGDNADIKLSEPVPFGAEDAVRSLPVDERQAALTIALFNMAAIPENENHGAFLNALRSVAGSSRVAVLIDESGYKRRLGAQAGADARLNERRDAWRYFCQAVGFTGTIVDLAAPDAAAIERDLAPSLGR